MDQLVAGLGCIGPGGAGQLDGHDEAVGIDGALFPDKGGNLPGRGPDLDIGRSLADDRRHYASESGELDFDRVMNCFSGRAD